jgi:hypothetical protein
MPILPVETQTNAVIQDQTTGVVDYLEYQGGTLVASDAIDYGLGPTWKIVANGDFGGGTQEDLVAQSTVTGQLDFLDLNAAGQLIASAMTPEGLPSVHGEGWFGGGAAGQFGPDLISQLPNGQLDFLAFNLNETLVASDLVANSVGLPTLVGGGTENDENAQFNGISANTGGRPGSVITQLANGELDAIGFNGTAANGTLSISGSLLMPQTIGDFPVAVVDPDFSDGAETTSENAPGSGGSSGVQLLSQSGSSADVLYLDSGYTTSSATEGALYGSWSLSPLPAGSNFVDGSFVAKELFPLT